MGQEKATEMFTKLRGLLMVAPPIVVIALFVGFPIVSGVMYTLGHTGGANETIASIAQHQHVSTGGLGTLDAYRDVFGDNQFRRSLVATIVVTLVSVVVVMVLAWGSRSTCGLRTTGLPRRSRRLRSCRCSSPWLLPPTRFSPSTLVTGS